MLEIPQLPSCSYTKNNKCQLFTSITNFSFWPGGPGQNFERKLEPQSRARNLRPESQHKTGAKCQANSQL